MKKPERILVIRLGALGDIVLCFQAFHEIRQAHPKAEIALLTMPAFADFARTMPWFNKIMTDDRASVRQLASWANLIKSIYAFNPTRVYDLQGKFRQTILYGLLGGPIGREWSGAAPFCTYPRPWPPMPNMHFTDFLSEQLRSAHVPASANINLDWLHASVADFNLPERYALLIPGCSPTHPYKRWPAAHYASLSHKLHEHGIASVGVGTHIEADVLFSIQQQASHLISLVGRTNLYQLATLARGSAMVIGNNTGPTHLAACMGAPTLCLMSEQCTPIWSSPRGPRTAWLQGHPLATLLPEKVLAALDALCNKDS